MKNPAREPRRELKKSDPSFEEASKQLKQKVMQLHREFGSDPMNKHVFKELEKMNKWIDAIAPYDPAVYALLEAQWMKLMQNYKDYLSNPKNFEFSKWVSDAFLVFKTEVENI